MLAKRFFLLLFLLLAAVACVDAAAPVAPATTAVPEPTSILTRIALDTAAQTCNGAVPPDRDFGLPPWPDTNFCRHSVPYEEIHSGGVGRDVIPAIDEPHFETIEEADVWLADVEPVLALALNEDARAYPLQVLVWHEIVNDVVDGRPVVVTYCPLCSSGLVFARVVAGEVLDFGTTGNLRNADLIMYDRQTESWWQQFTGEAIVGDMTGTQLTFLPSRIVSWADFKEAYGNGRVLSANTGYERDYGITPYVNYDALSSDRAGFFAGEPDERLPPKMRVMAVNVNDVAIAYPYGLLEEVKVVNDTRGGQALVVFWKEGTASPLYDEVIADSRDVGAAAVFSRSLNGQTLTFVPDGAHFRDEQTGSTWDFFGSAIDGPLAGEQLTSLPGHEFLWFAWAAFQPDTLIYEK